mmetsp:Transcript_3076/g.9582  ORF Transcript_3076/g.9582 Transcript_3076/m.9582 type:complete len:249 (-) Transcript_3076:359-1105(-)
MPHRYPWTSASYGTTRCSLNLVSAGTPRTSSLWSGIRTTWKSSYSSSICARYLPWIRCRASHMRHGASPFGLSTSWLTMMFSHEMLYFISSCTRRSVSYTERNSGMHTHTNVVLVLSANCCCTSRTFSRHLFTFSSISSDVRPVELVMSWLALATRFDRPCTSMMRSIESLSVCGSASRRRVWPVGAVSKTTVSKDMALISRMISAKTVTSSMPGSDDAACFRMLATSLRPLASSALPPAASTPNSLK